LISKESFIAKVDGVYNGVVVESDFCKKSFFVGEGAGSHPTATSVLSDIISIAKKQSNEYPKELKYNKYIYSRLEDRWGSYYLRFTTEDKPGVISGIANEFKRFKISMKSMLQKERENSQSKNATIVITTHNCVEKNMMQALRRINRLSFINKKTIYLRIEDFK
jgi:homoserine dehydrogenase